MNNIYDVIRHLVDNAVWPEDHLKQDAYAVLDQLTGGTEPVPSEQTTMGHSAPPETVA